MVLGVIFSVAIVSDGPHRIPGSICFCENSPSYKVMQRKKEKKNFHTPNLLHLTQLGNDVSSRTDNKRLPVSSRNDQRERPLDGITDGPFQRVGWDDVLTDLPTPGSLRRPTTHDDWWHVTSSTRDLFDTRNLLRRVPLILHFTKRESHSEIVGFRSRGRWFPFYKFPGSSWNVSFVCSHLNSTLRYISITRVGVTFLTTLYIGWAYKWIVRIMTFSSFY